MANLMSNDPLAHAGTPAVIGMRYRIRNIDSINFAEHLFARLLDGKPIDFWVNDVRNALGRRFIYDDLYKGRLFRQGLHYLYPTVCLQPIDGYIFVTDELGQHTILLQRIEQTIFYLSIDPQAADRYLLEHPKESLGPLWVALLSDIDQPTLP